MTGVNLLQLVSLVLTTGDDAKEIAIVCGVATRVAGFLNQSPRLEIATFMAAFGGLLISVMNGMRGHG